MECPSPRLPRATWPAEASRRATLSQKAAHGNYLEATTSATSTLTGASKEMIGPDCLFFLFGFCSLRNGEKQMMRCLDIKLRSLAQMCFSDSDRAQGGAVESTARPPSSRKCLRCIGDAPTAPLMYVAVHTLDQYKHSGAAVCSFCFFITLLLKSFPIQLNLMHSSFKEEG